MIRRNPFVPVVLMIVLFLAACVPTEQAADVSTNTPQPDVVILTIEPVVVEPEAEAELVDELETEPEAAVSDAIQGSVELARGACCAGGQAGNIIQVAAAFTAESSEGEIVSMRVKTHRASCIAANEMGDSDWEPFAEASSYEALASSGWSSLFISVQYQDGAGNVSAVFCDEVAVEGMPPLPESS